MLTPGKWYVGDTIRLAQNYQDEDGVDLDPDTVTLEILAPDYTSTTYVYGTDDELVRLDTGDYYCDFAPDDSGRWTYRWTSTGTGTSSVKVGRFVVQVDPWNDRVTSGYTSA